MEDGPCEGGNVGLATTPNCNAAGGKPPGALLAPALADAGQYTVNVYLNECPVAINNPELSANSSILGNNVVYTIADNPLVGNQVNQEKIWHRFYSPYISQNFQLQMTMSNLQMSNYDITNNNFVLHATTLYLSPNARMTQ